MSESPNLPFSVMPDPTRRAGIETLRLNFTMFEGQTLARAVSNDCPGMGRSRGFKEMSSICRKSGSGGDPSSTSEKRVGGDSHEEQMNAGAGKSALATLQG